MVPSGDLGDLTPLRAGTLAAAIAAVRTSAALLQGPYFTDLASGSLARGPFVRSQLEFMHAVDAFPHALAALEARTVGDAQAALRANLADERGATADDAHHATFRTLLRRLGVSERECSDHLPGAAVFAFNDSVIRACGACEPMQALAMLGMIEDLFADVSGFLGSAIVRRGWLRPEEIVHYATHEVLDRAHCAAFYAPLAPVWEAPDGPGAIAEGLSRGAESFVALFAGLHVVASTGEAGA